MLAKGYRRHDISWREVRAKGNDPHGAILEISSYEASGGIEYFLQYIDPEDRTIFALLRLRIPSPYFTGEKHFVEVLEGAAIIRELHVFGDQLRIGESSNGGGQHMGFGKRLLEEAEKIVQTTYVNKNLIKEKWGVLNNETEKHHGIITKIAVIAGVGVRGYYEKHWYTLDDEYLVKDINH
jgi:elongator complex protein 3